MDLLTLLGVVALAGGVGGAFNGWQINFFRSDLNTSDPAVEQVQDPNKKASVREAIEKPKTEKWGSVFFNVATGALAAAVSWSAYGPYALENVLGGAASTALPYGLTLTALATAVVIGFGGPRWLTNERDKTLLKQAADDAAVTGESETKRELMQRADPKQKALIAGMDI
jgi:hypothetical protein